MNALRISLSGNVVKACALTLFAASAACSSSSSAAPAAGGSSSGGSSSGGSDGGGTLTAPGPTMDGPSSGMLCPTLTTATYATKITLNVTWPGTQAVKVGTTGQVLIWLLSTYNVDSSNNITGTTTTCGNSTPPITLTDTADQLTGLPSGSQVQNAFPASSWAMVPTTAVKGVLGGYHVGASMAIGTLAAPIVTLYGVAASSSLNSGTTAWPANGSDIDPTTITTASGMPVAAGGLPGVTALPVGTSPFVLPKTSLSMDAPSADQLQIILRTALALYGTSSDCDNQSGTAFVSQLNNHVVGCSLANDGGACTADMYNFIDGNTTQYKPGTGTFDAKKLADGASCADVLSMLP